MKKKSIITLSIIFILLIIQTLFFFYPAPVNENETTYNNHIPYVFFSESVHSKEIKIITRGLSSYCYKLRRCFIAFSSYHIHGVNDNSRVLQNINELV